MMDSNSLTIAASKLFHSKIHPDFGITLLKIWEISESYIKKGLKAKQIWMQNVL